MAFDSLFILKRALNFKRCANLFTSYSHLSRLDAAAPGPTFRSTWWHEWCSSRDRYTVHTPSSSLLVSPILKKDPLLFTVECFKARRFLSGCVYTELRRTRNFVILFGSFILERTRLRSRWVHKECY